MFPPWNRRLLDFVTFRCRIAIQSHLCSMFVGIRLGVKVKFLMFLWVAKMTDEQKILNAFRASDDRGRKAILEFAVSTAEDWPAPRQHGSSPILANAGDAVALPERELDDFEPPAIIGAPV